MSKTNINRVDFETIQLMCRMAKGQLRRPMFNPVEFDGIRWFSGSLVALTGGGE